MPRKGMHTITVYVTQSELDAANKAASASDLSTSRWVRQLIAQALGENWPDELGAHGDESRFKKPTKDQRAPNSAQGNAPRCPSRKGHIDFITGRMVDIHDKDHHVSVFGMTPGGAVILECHECWRIWYSKSQKALAFYAQEMKKKSETEIDLTK